MSSPLFPLQGLDQILPKIQSLSPSDIYVMADYDLTLASKDRAFFDRAPLTKAQHEGLQALCSNIGRFSVVTARGQRTALSYLSAYGVLPKALLASNSGHVVQTDLLHVAEPLIIPIPGYNGRSIRAMVQGIHGIVGSLKTEFPEILDKRRELCGAVVFQFDGDRGSKRYTAFEKASKDVCGEISAEIAQNLIYSSKVLETMVPGVGLQTQGYIDIKPKGMDKGIAATKLVQQFSQSHTSPFIVVAGDSGPDFDMMKAVAALVPADRRLFVSVGTGLMASNQAYKERTGGGLLDVVLPGQPEESVQSFHDLLAIVGRTPFRNRVSSRSIFQAIPRG